MSSLICLIGTVWVYKQCMSSYTVGIFSVQIVCFVICDVGPFQEHTLHPVYLERTLSG